MYTKTTKTASPSSSLNQTLHNIKNKLPPTLQAPFLTAIRAFGVSWAITTLPGIIGLLVKLCLALIKQKSMKTKLIQTFLFIELPKQLGNSIFKNGFPWLITGVFSSHHFVTYFLKKWHFLLLKKYPNLKISTLLPSLNNININTNNNDIDNNNNEQQPTHSKRMIFLTSLVTMFITRRLFPKLKTMELTFFVLVRALDVFSHRAYHSKSITDRVPSWIMKYGNVIVFTIACTEIMFSWFYEPERLPRGYSKWITNLAEMDVRLLEALRLIRNKTWLYGKDTGVNGLLGDLCVDIGLPYELGASTRGRIPCTVVHGGNTWGCEANALIRFTKGFIKVFSLYFTVHFTPHLIFRRDKLVQDPIGSAINILKASARSSAFIATFIALIWYSVCLTRTRIGHQILRVNQTILDDTLAPLIGCMMCGLSLLIENKHRRGEMALYVVPRALFSLTERIVEPWFVKGRKWEPKVAEAVETMAFAASMTTLISAMYNDRNMVRSSVKGLLNWIMKYELPSNQKNIKEEELKKEIINDDGKQ
ncbi:unnamed protein product [Cunninghamella blakesleeana]